MQNSVEYLGYHIDSTGLHATESKVKAVLGAPTPRNIHQLRSFLGLLNYYGKFIPNLATILYPLNCLLKRGQRWKWSPACKAAFESAKKELTSAGVLVHYNPDLPIKLAADASNYGLGAVISHVTPEGSERPIAFASRTLTASESNYSQIDKEALALIFGVKKFNQYLYGRRFTLVTDHKPLTTLLGPKKGIPPLAAARLQRWALLLSAYQYDIEFKPTQEHGNADGLSRLPLKTLTLSEPPVSEATVFNIAQVDSLPVTVSQVEAATRSDPVLSRVLRYTRTGWPVKVQEELKPYIRRKDELATEGDCLMWGIRVVIPKKLQCRVLQDLHSGHPGVVRMKSVARSHAWWPRLDEDIQTLATSCQQCLEGKNAPPEAPLHPWEWPARPWQRLHIDFAGPFLGKNFFVIIDAHSKWPEVIDMPTTTATKTIGVLRGLFASYGLPEQIVSDNGPQFTSDEFTHFCRQNGIRHIQSAPYHPATNGAVERFIQTLKKSLRAGSRDGLNLPFSLANFLLQYRITPHATTAAAPSSLFLGRKLRTRLDLLHPSVEKQVRDSQVSQKVKHDSHVRQREFTVGDLVMARNFRPGPRWTQGKVSRRIGPRQYLVRMCDGNMWRRHIDHLIRRGGREETSSELQTSDSDLYWPVTNSPTVDDSTQNTSPSSQPNPVGSSSERRYPSRDRQPPDRYCPTSVS